MSKTLLDLGTANGLLLTSRSYVFMAKAVPSQKRKR